MNRFMNRSMAATSGLPRGAVMTYTLYLVRHGTTKANLEGRYVGWEEHPLSPEGKAQAERLARHLAGLKPAALCASDLRRTQQTARAISRTTGLAVRLDPRLRELNFGRFSGLTYEEITSRWPAEVEAWLADPERVPPPEGESLETLRERSLAALPLTDGAVVVTHGGVIRAVLSYLTGRPFWSWQVPLGSLTQLEWDGERCLGEPVVWPEVRL